MVFNDLVDVRLAMYFEKVHGLAYIDTIEAFDNTQVIKWVLHALLYGVTDAHALFCGFACNDEVIDLCLVEVETRLWSWASTPASDAALQQLCTVNGWHT